MVMDTQITLWRNLLLRWTDLFSRHEQSRSFPRGNYDNPMVRFSHREQMQNATGSFMQCSEDNKNMWDAEIIWLQPEVRDTIFKGRRRLVKGHIIKRNGKFSLSPCLQTGLKTLVAVGVSENAMVYDLMV